MGQNNTFEREIILPDEKLTKRETHLVGFENRYLKVQNQFKLLLNISDLHDWSEKHHKQYLQICEYVTEQYPFVIFHGDIGTGKTVTAENIANRMVRESRGEDVILFKLSNKVRGSGLVGESSTNLADAFQTVIQSAGKGRQAILLIDEGDSLGESREQLQSHHEDKVIVNTLIQGIDELRNYGGRIVLILCTNRIHAIDSAVIRRAAIIEEFNRPSDSERTEIFKRDLDGLKLSDSQIKQLVKATGEKNKLPPWTYSDIRTRLYPAALAMVFPNEPLSFKHLISATKELTASPQMEHLK